MENGKSFVYKINILYCQKKWCMTHELSPMIQIERVFLSDIFTRRKNFNEVLILFVYWVPNSSLDAYERIVLIWFLYIL